MQAFLGLLVFRPTPQTAFVGREEVGVGGGGGYIAHIWAIKVCAAVKGMVLEQYTLG